MNENEISELSENMNELINGKIVKRCVINGVHELVIFFEDGMRLFVNSKTDLDFSITE